MIFKWLAKNSKSKKNINFCKSHSFEQKNMRLKKKKKKKILSMNYITSISTENIWWHFNFCNPNTNILIHTGIWRRVLVVPFPASLNASTLWIYRQPRKVTNLRKWRSVEPFPWNEYIFWLFGQIYAHIFTEDIFHFHWNSFFFIIYWNQMFTVV